MINTISIFFVISAGNPFNQKSWSGTPYHIIKSIEKYPSKDSLGNILPIRTIWCAPTANFSSNTIIHTLDSLDEKDIYEECNE